MLEWNVAGRRNKTTSVVFSDISAVLQHLHLLFSMCLHLFLFLYNSDNRLPPFVGRGKKGDFM